MPYETSPRIQPTTVKTPDAIKRLPIKLANGKIQQTGVKTMILRPPPLEEPEAVSESEVEEEPQRVEDVSTGARFGRPAVVDVLQTKSRKHRIEMAKEQIAGICQDILADPENGVSLGFPNPLFSISINQHWALAWSSQTITFFFSPNSYNTDAPRTCSQRSNYSQTLHSVSIGHFQGYNSGLPNTTSDRY